MTKGTAAANPPNMEEMIDALTKTFVISHETDSDEHLAQALVFNAGRLAWRLRSSVDLKAEQKTNVTDVVTVADRAAERFVAGVLARLRPEDGLLGEEGASSDSSSGRRWVIDPIDGTWNFTSGSDYFCSALALVEDDNPIFGAVHRPAMGYTWFGGPSLPTTRDGQPVPRLDKAPMSQLCLGTYLHPTRFGEPVKKTWEQVISNFGTVRMLGSASIDLGSVADGTLGAWLQHSVAEWDWQPGRALVEGAGGSTARVGKWCIAGNSQVVKEMAEVLNNADSI